MDGLTILLLLTVLTCVFIYLWRDKSDKNLPPLKEGTISTFFRLLFTKQSPRTTYGRGLDYDELYRIKFGGIMVLVLNSPRVVQEAFINQGDIFSGRQNDTISKAMNQGGIITTDGPLWHEHRRFMLRLLRDFGMGKSMVSELIQDEVKAMLDAISNANGSPIDTVPVFTSAINNVVARLTFGERSGTEDANFKDFVEHVDKLFTFSPLTLLLLIFPFIVHIPSLRSKIPVFYHNDAINDYIKEKVKERSLAMKAMDIPVTDVEQASNICEALLIEQKNRDQSNPDGHSFTGNQITRNMADLFLAGTDTTSATLNWATLLMATHPQVQRRVQQEIEDKIGRQRLPVLADKPELPFASAVMDEVMRYSSIVPLSVAHRTLKDTQLLGYDIPADTIIQTNIYSIHHNSKYWARPFDFHPEHFLSETGTYTPSKQLIPFSIGKRACLGESLARMEYFIAFVALMQKFEVRLSSNDAPNSDAILEGSMRAIRHPLKHNIVFEPLDK